jgi:hypothetical protein
VEHRSAILSVQRFFLSDNLVNDKEHGYPR